MLLLTEPPLPRSRRCLSVPPGCASSSPPDRHVFQHMPEQLRIFEKIGKHDSAVLSLAGCGKTQVSYPGIAFSDAVSSSKLDSLSGLGDRQSTFPQPSNFIGSRGRELQGQKAARSAVRATG